VKFLKIFDIEIIKFKEGHHEIEFKIGDDFFKNFEDNQLLEKGRLTVRVMMDKGVSVIDLTFLIEGTVELTCDRSLEVFDHPIHIKEKIIYKYGAEEQEIDEHIFMITRDTPLINVAQLIYEFVLLSLPAKKIHPDYRNELDDEDDFQTEGGFVYLDNDAETDENEEDSDQSSKPIDPRWEQLLKLKDKDKS
jgi:uncharacterized metal-binding protein YceD (DUF177 family)